MSEKIFTKAFVKEVNTEERTLVAVASTENVDRDREIIEVSGWKLENFLKNPVLIWGHNYHIPPIGRVLWVKQEGDALKFKAQFHNKTQLASEVWELYKSGYLKAFSVGFIPRSWEDKEGNENVRRVFKEVELLEISAVPVPANPDALVQAINEGQIQIRSKSILDAIKEGENMETIEKIWEETENEIRHSVRDPKDFQQDSFRRITLKRDKPRVFAIIGKLKGETKTTIQSLRFPKADGWTMAKAKQWVKEHPEISRSFEEGEMKEIFPDAEFEAEEKTFDIEAKLDQIAEAVLRVEEKLVVLSEKLFEKVEVKKKDESPADENPETSGEEIDPGEVREIAETVVEQVIRRITGRDV